MELHPEITYFNWYELISKARKDQSAILILTFAQTKLYNPYTTKGLMKALNINHIPVHLFSTGLLEQKKDKLICNYKTQEPMSYFKNPWFLTQNVSVLKKTEYLQMLSMRRISEAQDYIAKNYIRKDLQNPFIKIKGDKIYFPQESSETRKSYT
tara:strand:+ start:382 stop:843 length:462 start_codon:yes stop_codon:yes gene_type:complete